MFPSKVLINYFIVVAIHYVQRTGRKNIQIRKNMDLNSVISVFKIQNPASLLQEM